MSRHLPETTDFHKALMTATEGFNDSDRWWYLGMT